MSIFYKYVRTLKGLLLITIFLFILSIGLSMLYVYTGWEPLLPISKGFTTGISNMILLITGAIIASFVGAFFSAWSHDMELEETKKQVAAGFYQELSVFKTNLQNIQHDDVGRLLAAIQLMIPLYTQDGLYYIFRKEIYLLEKDISEPLIELYSKILKLADIQESLKNKNTTGYQSPQQIVDIVNSINHEIEVILPILEERKNR